MKKTPIIIKFLKKTFRHWKRMRDESGLVYKASYRIIDIEKNENSEYFVTIQLIGKNHILTLAPEKLLADNEMVDKFSPSDIRNLTYLGYLGINAPQYTILAKKLSEKNDQMLFALRKKGEKKYSVLTAHEITRNSAIIKGLTQEEAYMLGITASNEQQIIEVSQKKQLLNELKKKSDAVSLNGMKE